MSITETFAGVELNTRASVHFDGKCVSHSFVTADGARKTVGVVLPARLAFATREPEVMECVAGSCRYRLQGESSWQHCAAGQSFSVPADSSFDIEVSEPFHYICHYG